MSRRFFADVGDLMRGIGFWPESRVKEGIHVFVAWYRDHYEV
jgi:UDP-glucuronate 4-epimerase